MNMTYAQLAEQIVKMTDDQKNCNVTVYVPGIDECFPIDAVSFAGEETDVLDIGHPILNIANED